MALSDILLDDMNKVLSPIQREELLKRFPELRSFVDQHETKSMLKELLNRKPSFEGAEMIKGDKGDRGDDGKTPEKGVDYFTQEEIEAVKDYIKTLTKAELTPKKGTDYFTQEEIEGIKKSATPIKGKHYFDGRHGKDGAPGRAGRDGYDGPPGPKGKDGTEVAPAQIAERLNRLKGVVKFDVLDLSETGSLMDMVVKELKDPKSKRRLKATDIVMNDQRWHGGGLSTVAHDATLTGSGTSSSPLSVVSSASATWRKETPAGAIDGVNVTYTLAHIPLENSMNLVVNGQVYTEGVDYTIATNIITMTSPLPSEFASLPLVAQYQS